MRVKEQLLKLKKSELEDLVASHNIPGYYKMKKEELAEKISELILTKKQMFFEYIKLDVAQIRELLMLGTNGKATLYDSNIPYSFLCSGYLYFYQKTHEVEWCSDAFELFKDCCEDELLKKDRKLIRKIMAYGNAFTELYGVIPVKKAFEFYIAQNSDMSFEEFSEVLKLAEAISTWEIEDDKIIAQHILFEDEVELVEYMHGDTPYYVMTKQEIMRYEDTSYFEKTKQFYALKRFLEKELNCDSQMAEEIADDITLECALDCGIQNFVVQLERRNIVFDSEEQAEEFIYLCMELDNNTRRYKNRGFTPNEMIRMDRRKEAEEKKNAKIGRNDPCPCGSGKKYKKCCGR